MKKESKNRKRITRGLLSAALMFTVCLGMSGFKSDAEQVTMEEIVEANKVENLLTHYNSVYAMATFRDDGEQERYVDKEISYVKSAYIEEIETPDTIYGCDDGTYCGFVYVDKFQTNRDAYYAYIGLDGNASVEQTVTSVKEEGDVLVVRAEYTTEAFKEVAENMKVEYKDGDFVVSDMRIDGETYAILEDGDTLCRADGTEEELNSVTIVFDEARPERAEALLERIGETSDLRTTTIIVNPGTDYEKAYSSKVPKGESVEIQIDEGWKLYLDSDCTKEYSGEVDLNEDFTLYMKTNDETYL